MKKDCIIFYLTCEICLKRKIGKELTSNKRPLHAEMSSICFLRFSRTQRLPLYFRNYELFTLVPVKYIISEEICETGFVYLVHQV